MKKLILAMLWLCAHETMAQQKPHYTQYILNQYIINPALTGIENYTDVKLSHRMQWVGIQDAPVTTYATIHGPIGKMDTKTTATSFSTPGENPRGNRYWEEYTVSDPHHGWGLQVVNDRTGPLNNFSAMGTYAYHIGLSPRMNLSAGIGVGIANMSLNRSKLEFATPVDPAVLANGDFNKVKLNVNAGLYLYSSDFFIGLSAQQIVPQKIGYVDNTLSKLEGKLVPHLFVTAGYRFLISEDVNLTPSVLVKYVSPAPIQPEFNAKLQYLDKVWIGGSYRYKDGMAAMAGLNISSTVNVGYSYDYTTSKLNNFSKGTHEIVVGFLIGNRFGDSCPRNVW